MVVRVATPADATGIASVHVRAWQSAYRHVFGAALDELTVETRAQRWKSWLGEAAERTVTLVAERDGRIAGFAGVGPSRDEDAPAGAGELYSIYVDPSEWGSGLAASLMAEATALLGSFGFGEATLWVLGENPRARRFYERHGWFLDGGERTGEHLGIPTHELRYRLLLPQ